ncbi:MAG: FG-GAP-like repeat-containing protein, partial [Chitinophagaceae bacterium]
METANFSGVSATDWSWGALFFDADNDGLSDIYVCNGVNRDVTNLDFMDFFANEVVQNMVVSGQKENIDSVLKRVPVNAVANSSFRNLGGLRFTDAAREWGLSEPSFSNGAAYADLDNDGDLDLVVNNENQPAFVYRNNARELTRNNFLAVQVKGTAKNPFGVGTKIKLFSGAQVFYRELIPSRGFQSSMDYKQVIGLGVVAVIDSMQIVWPNRVHTSYKNPAINITHYLAQPAGGIAPPPATGNSRSAGYTLFQEVPASFEKHTEDDYEDFYFERNLLQMLSREGPHVATGDVDGDGQADIFIGGAKNNGGKLYLRKKDASFIKKDQPAFQLFKDFEDVALVFLDADGDRDLDLFIGAGGNNVRPGGRQIQHRLYKNDGNANFTLDPGAFQSNNMNTAVAVANDYDDDGDLDLFVGSRSVPNVYGQTPQSYLYQNNGQGRFKDVAPSIIGNAGMITGAVWVDITGDSNKELVVTGDWMPTKIFT